MAPREVTSETWRELLRPALRIIEEAERGYGRFDYRLGGGTVLMFRFQHRLSKDIDIFTYDAQALGFLSPRLNQVGEREQLDYLEQANTLKITLRAGDIDFIVAAPVIPDAKTSSMVFDGVEVELDATSEILAKKLAYRADDFKIRDMFDLVTALALDRPAALSALAATQRTRPALRARLPALERALAVASPDDILATAVGQVHFADMVPKLLAAMADVDG